MSGVGMSDGNVSAAGVTAKRARLGVMEFTNGAITGVASIDGLPYPPAVSGIGPFVANSIVRGTGDSLPAPILQDSGALLRTYVDGFDVVEARSLCFDGDDGNACVGFNVAPRLVGMTCGPSGGPFPAVDYGRLVALETETLQLISAAGNIVARTSVQATGISSTIYTSDGLHTVADSVITATTNRHAVYNTDVVRTQLNLEDVDATLTSTTGNVALVAAADIELSADQNVVIQAIGNVTVRNLTFPGATVGNYTWPAAVPTTDSVLRCTPLGALSWDPTPYEINDTAQLYAQDAALGVMVTGGSYLLVQRITATLYRLTGNLYVNGIGTATPGNPLAIKYPNSLPAVAPAPEFVQAPLTVAGTNASVVLPTGLTGWVITPSIGLAKSFDVKTVSRTTGTSLTTTDALVNSIPYLAEARLGFDILLYTV